MENNKVAIKEFVEQFIENYTPEIIKDDVVGFYNDAFLLLQHFYSLDNFDTETEAFYVQFINHIIENEQLLKEYSNFDFGSIKTLASLQKNTDFKSLTPIYTPYNFTETEETIDQIFEELKTVKEFHKELKEEIAYLLDEYKFHLEHLKENMQYNFYTYEELEETNPFDLDEKIEELQQEKQKFIQKYNDKLYNK
ncbi:hypothetical protein SAMN02927937_01175 [Paenimyroides aquimaris]|uniref:DUF4375 domain-containing protein n=1 Tax=Paenimyroides marinum TaxID=1159016 RepID=A0A1H6KRF7_9FLAO|nr:hypothetical protein [Paenimyroides aquimaris]SEH74201.1 hypothetical protein SAMN02927937_01175 [Paenimyroides aquimaris]